MSTILKANYILIQIIISCILTCCTKERYPILETLEATGITGRTATCGGNILDDGGSSIIARGVCWSTITNPSISDFKSEDGPGAGSFTSSLSGLEGSKTYFVRAYATNKDGTGYGTTVTFKTLLEIGSTYSGGIVFYIDQSGDHGLIAAPSDLISFRRDSPSVYCKWYNGNFSYTNATGTIVGTGLSNTNNIVTKQGTGTYAAKICLDNVMNSYSDWYLPSIDELGLMYINLKLNSLGNFADDKYWSSTEVSSTKASYQYFGNGTQTTTTKDFEYRVRAIRTF